MSSQSTTPPISPPPAQVTPAAAGKIALFVAVLGWAYLPMLRIFADKWLHDPQYSHGLLVPFFSAYLIWRARAEAITFKPMPILGFSLLGGLLSLRAVAGAILFHQLDAASLLLSLVAVSLVIGGLPLL